MKNKILSNKKMVLIIILVAIVAAAIFFVSGRSEVSFEIKDRCGPIVNMISHTINDESGCRSQCKSQCKVKDLKYAKVEFEESMQACHSCICYCK
ncbi:MAG: hypothetical protein ABIC04_04120 [Nanoarchaeota archaeon]